MHKTSKIVESDVVKSVESFVNYTHPVLKPFEFKEYDSIWLDLIRVSRSDIGSYIKMDESVDKEYLADWKRDIGYFVNRDFKRQNDSGKYFVMDMNGNTILLREYSEEETDDITERELNHLTMGDAFQGFHHYSIVRIMKPEESYRMPKYITSSFNIEDLDESSVLNVDELEDSEEIIENALF